MRVCFHCPPPGFPWCRPIAGWCCLCTV